MNLRQNVRNKREEVDVNLTAVMNIFLILIPFLILTAAFVKLAVIDFSLPTAGSGNNSATTPPEEKMILTVIDIKSTGELQLKSTGSKFDPIPPSDATGKYDYQKLIAQLLELKAKHQAVEDIILIPDNGVKYDVIIQIMDRCRENGFPNISLS
ncbi:biopolymer transporter ExbD [candidate division KSB1 bacterium]|nr:biopolymer transporter ExbD [candidate division KSB1 bacterium]